MKKLLILSAFLLTNYLGFSQSSPVKVTNVPLPVSVSGGTFTPAGTTTVTQAAGTTFTTQQKAGTTFTVHETGTNTVTPAAGSIYTISATGAYTIASTYSYVTVAGTATITSGALSVSVANVGDNSALFNGTTLPAGSVLNFQIPNAILPQFTYNCLTSVLMVKIDR